MIMQRSCSSLTHTHTHTRVHTPTHLLFLHTPSRFHLMLLGVLTALTGGATNMLSWRRSQTTSSSCPTMSVVKYSAHVWQVPTLATTPRQLECSSTGLWVWTHPSSYWVFLGMATTTLVWVSPTIMSVRLRRFLSVERTAVMLQVRLKCVFYTDTINTGLLSKYICNGPLINYALKSWMCLKVITK